jgi:outer membrane lipoprotein SlyB
MRPTVRKPFTFTVLGASTAIAAAFTLAACGPNDSADSAQLAATPSTATAAQGTPVPVVAPPIQVAAAQPIPAPAPAQSVPPTPTPTAGQAPAPDDAVPSAAPAPRAVDRSRVGAVTGIEPIRERPQGTGAGAVIGGVLGGVVGHQFGSGTGKAVMTGAGAVGGAIAGNNIERNRNTRVVGYRVHVRLDNGTTRTFQRTQVGNLHVGDRVALDARSFHRV